MTANWAAARAGDVWTAPLGGGVGKLFRLGEILPLEAPEIAELPINTQIQAFGNIAAGGWREVAIALPISVFVSKVNRKKWILVRNRSRVTANREERRNT